MEEFKPFTIERPWGNFRQLTHNSNSTVKVHRISPEGQSSLQSHSKRTEFWHIVSGEGTVTIADKKHEARSGDEFMIAVGEKHRWQAGSSGMVLVEVAEGDFIENDEVRYEDKYGRA